MLLKNNSQRIAGLIFVVLLFLYLIYMLLRMICHSLTKLYATTYTEITLITLKIEAVKQFIQKLRAFAIHIVLHSFRKHWRKQGAKYCLLAFIGAVWSTKVVGLVCIVMLTVPCGIQKVNTDKRLWYLRQLYFAGIAALNLLA